MGADTDTSTSVSRSSSLWVLERINMILVKNYLYGEYSGHGNRWSDLVVCDACTEIMLREFNYRRPNQSHGHDMNCAALARRGRLLGEIYPSSGGNDLWRWAGSPLARAGRSTAWNGKKYRTEQDIPSGRLMAWAKMGQTQENADKFIDDAIQVRGSGTLEAKALAFEMAARRGPRGWRIHIDPNTGAEYNMYNWPEFPTASNAGVVRGSWIGVLQRYDYDPKIIDMLLGGKYEVHHGPGGTLDDAEDNVDIVPINHGAGYNIINDWPDILILEQAKKRGLI